MLHAELVVRLGRAVLHRAFAVSAHERGGRLREQFDDLVVVMDMVRGHVLRRAGEACRIAGVWLLRTAAEHPSVEDSDTSDPGVLVRDNVASATLGSNPIKKIFRH